MRRGKQAERELKQNLGLAPPPPPHAKKSDPAKSNKPKPKEAKARQEAGADQYQETPPRRRKTAQGDFDPTEGD